MGTGKNYLNYGEISRSETSKIFFERFLLKAKERMEKFFGTGECKRVLEAFSTGRIDIIGLENFLHPNFDVNDQTLKIYKETKSAEEFFYKGLLYFKKQAETGNTHIVIREFILAFMDMLRKGKYDISEEQTELYIKILLYNLRNMTHASPFYIQILETKFKSLVNEKLKLRYGAGYKKFLQAFFKVYKEMHEEVDNKELLPKVEIIYGVYPDTRKNQIRYLSSVSGIYGEFLEAILRPVEDLAVDSTELRIAFDNMEQRCGKKFNRESLLLELQRIKELNPYKLFPITKNFTDLFHDYGISRSVMNLKNIKKYCVNMELFEEGFGHCYSNIEIDCTGLATENLDYYIDAVKTLTLLRVYSRREEGNMDFRYKITLVNVEDLSHEFISYVKKKMKQLKSTTSRNFFIDVRYKYETITQKFPKQKDPYIRVISDIHADYNQNRYSYNFGDDFIINCGDTAGDAITSAQWDINHMQHGVVVAGNHLGYSPCFPDHDKMDFENTKSKQINILAQRLFVAGKNLRFLSNSETEYEGVVILGTTLFTDFALYGDEHIEEAMKYAKDNMNDFRVVTVAGHRNYTKDENGKWDKGWKPRTEEWNTRLFSPHDHAYYFDHSLNFLKEKVLEHRDKPIIIVTHHAPTPYAISPQYAGSMLNPAFASNLNKFIISNPQIRLWCFGHIHSKSDIILGQTRLVCDPFGYNNENNADLPYNYGTRIRVANIKSKRPWTDICSEEIKYGLIKVYES